MSSMSQMLYRSSVVMDEFLRSKSGRALYDLLTQDKEMLPTNKKSQKNKEQKEGIENQEVREVVNNSPKTSTRSLVPKEVTWETYEKVPEEIVIIY